jgi:uncharacterized protein (TIGR04255 family)
MSSLEQPTLPFGGDEPLEEVLLSRPPLTAVVAQARFPTIASIAREDFIGPFQEAIRDDFPILRAEREASVVITSQGIEPGSESGVVWRFHDREETWHVSLTPSFVALDTSSYVDSADFVNRFRRLLASLDRVIAPATCDRLGIRYVDRIVLESALDELNDLIRRELVGVASTNLRNEAELVHSISDTRFSVGDAVLHGRWGLLPPNASLDPLHGDPVASPTWILDLDMFSSRAYDFDVNKVAELTQTYADRIYRFFRWSVMPELLVRCGAMS